MRVVGYIRVSTEEQANFGVSLEAQGDKVRGYCRIHDHELIDLIEDQGVSAKSLKRPGIQRVLGMLRADEAEGVVITKLDRLTRSLGDWDQLISEFFGDGGGKSLMSVGDSIDTRTAAGRLVLNVLMSTAQWEREVITERTVDALRHMQSRGQRVSRTPFGYDLAEDGKTLVRNEAEQDALIYIREAGQAGTPLRQIAAELERKGIAPKSGKEHWSHTTVKALLKRGEPKVRRKAKTS